MNLLSLYGIYLINFLNISNFFFRQFQNVVPEHSIFSSVYFFKAFVIIVILILLVSFPLPENLKYPAFAGFVCLCSVILYFTFYNFVTLEFPLQKKLLWNFDSGLGFSEMILYYLNVIPYTLQIRSTMKEPKKYSKVKI